MVGGKEEGAKWIGVAAVLRSESLPGGCTTGTVVAFNNNNANEDHSWGIKWEGNDTTLEYNYKILQTLVNQKRRIPPAKLTDKTLRKALLITANRAGSNICGAGFSALWKGMFPNAWARTCGSWHLASTTDNDHRSYRPRLDAEWQ